MNYSKVISTELDSLKKRIVKLVRYGRSDVQTSNEIGPFGIDSNPLKDMVALYAPTGEDGKTVIIGYINKNQKAAVGEVRLYSLDSGGGEKMYAWLKADGTMELGGDSDNMVRYSKTAEAFNQLKTDHNTAVASYNAFCASVSLLTGIPFSPVAPSTADITPAKINEIKTIK